jgi:hypothetical protein
MRTRARSLSDSLQEQGFDAVAAHQRDPRANADAADADHLPGRLHSVNCLSRCR